MLHIHRADRADALIAALGGLLASPAGDPFAPDVVAVPTRGMERWLTQRLSAGLGASDGRADGVCANVAFPSPRALVDGAVAAASGIEQWADRWTPERLVWPLLEVVDECLGEPWLEVLAAHFGGSDAGDSASGRRFGSVRHIAELFDRYALHRPAMVRAWADGEDTAWQAELWRRLDVRIEQPGPAERLEAACTRLRAQPEVAELPERMSVFGVTRLPAGHLQVLHALAEHRDVHVFVLHPSAALWRRVAAVTADGPPIVRRAEDPTAHLPANRLLASWGHDARELQLVVGSAVHQGHEHPTARDEDTLLARIQAGVVADRMPPDDPPPALAPGDRSVQVHACHGRARQVEVLRDAILHELQDDPTLEPRDVIVMCPDIEAFAPLIGATFGAGEVSEDDDELEELPPELRPPDLRVRLADRSLRQTNPVLGVVGRLLELADQRLTASQVLDLADREPVRRRFRLDDDALARMEDWVAESGVRWGLDASHRAPFKLEALSAGTWAAGLDRLLVGVTMTEDERLFGGVLPLEDVESGAIDLAGRFAELVDRLQTAVDALREPKTIDHWADAIATAAEALTATTPRDAWQRAQLQRILDDVVAEATAGGAVHPATLALPELRALLAERLKGRPTRANFRTGHLTICTLAPMRSVPHRVVCLLGLDDNVFPRKAPRDGDDLILADPHVGDRDSRTEDRQMLLDALLAATDRLIVTFTGNDERTNVPRPPAVPVGELLDTIDRTVFVESGTARERIVVQHPLQPFDVRNFVTGELVDGAPWSFDQVTLAGARALGAQRATVRPFLLGPLPDAAGPLIEVSDLVRFVEHPARAFLRQRLGIGIGDYFEAIEDGLPVELDALEVWGVGQRLLDARLAGTSEHDAVAAEIARGALPPGGLATPVLTRVRPMVESIAACVRALPSGTEQAGSLDVRVALPGGRTLSGTVPGVSGDLLRSVTYSRVAAKHRLATWVRLLALTAARPERAFEAVTVGRAGSGQASVRLVRIAPLGDDAQARRDVAIARLQTLVDLYDRGMREPSPLGCASSAAYAQAAAAGRDAEAAGRKVWESGWKYPSEDKDLEHQLVLGGVRTFAERLAEPPRADEHGPGWDDGDATRFGRYARRLWAGPLAHEDVQDR